MPQHLYMETTTVEVGKTCGEIEQILVRNGARGVFKNFSPHGLVDALEFVIPVDGTEVYFKLPFRWQAVQDLAKRGETGSKKTAMEAQARRVAARLVLRWVQAQFALVETGMVKMEEVFLPYVAAPSGEVFFEYVQRTGGIKALSSGKGES